MSSQTVLSLEEIDARVLGVLGELLGDGLAAVDPDQPLTEALGERYDSLTALECISRVETEFGIEVDFVAQDVRYAFATLRRIAEFVRDDLEDRAVLGGHG